MKLAAKGTIVILALSLLVMCINCIYRRYTHL